VCSSDLSVILQTFQVKKAQSTGGEGARPSLPMKTES